MLLLTIGCAGERIEGTEPGDCTDHADNDADGGFDCDDDGCAGGPDCVDDTGDGGDTASETGDSGGESGAESGEDSGVDSGETGDDSEEGESGDSVPSAGCTVAADGSAAYTDLQDAVDDALDGDTLVVCPGVYGPVEVSRVSVTIRGEGEAGDVVLDGRLGPGLTILERTVEVENVTFTGTADAEAPCAVYAYEAEASFTDVRIEGCDSAATANSWAVLVEGGQSRWWGVYATDNALATSLFAVWGGATMEIGHALFEGNAYDPAAARGGMLLFAGQARLSVHNSLFVGNVADSQTNLVSIVGTSDHRSWFYNNVLADNQGYEMVYADAWLDFENNIVAFNDGAGMGNTGGYDVVCEYSAFYGNSLGDLGGSVASVDCVEGDPRFVDKGAGDYHLDSGFSPCVDAGSPQSGHDDVDGTRNDMGAYGGPDGAW